MLLELVEPSESESLSPFRRRISMWEYFKMSPNSIRRGPNSAESIVFDRVILRIIWPMTFDRGDVYIRSNAYVWTSQRCDRPVSIADVDNRLSLAYGTDDADLLTSSCFAQAREKDDASGDSRQPEVAASASEFFGQWTFSWLEACWVPGAVQLHSSFLMRRYAAYGHSSQHCRLNRPAASMPAPKYDFSACPSYADDGEYESPWQFVDSYLNYALGYGLSAAELAERSERIRQGTLGLVTCCDWLQTVVRWPRVTMLLLEGKLARLNARGLFYRCSRAFCAHSTCSSGCHDLTADTEIRAHLGSRTSGLGSAHQPTRTYTLGMSAPVRIGHLRLYHSPLFPHSHQITQPSVSAGTYIQNKLRPCCSCFGLRSNTTLTGIVDRMENGIHENTPHAYLPFSSLGELLKRKNTQIDRLRFDSLNRAGSHLVRGRTINGYRLSVCRICIRSSQPAYIKSSPSLGGMPARSSRSLGLPSLSGTGRKFTSSPVLASAGVSTVLEMLRNLQTILPLGDDDFDSPMAYVIEVDELKLEKGFRREPCSNMILGSVKSTDINARWSSAPVSCLSDNHNKYAVLQFVISGTCKQEDANAHAVLLERVVEALRTHFGLGSRRKVYCIASDGESRRGKALGALTMSRELGVASPIYPLLQPFSLFNRLVGANDLTCDKNWRHVLKRFQNALLRSAPLGINGSSLSRPLIKVHPMDGLEMKLYTADSLLSPNDPQELEQLGAVLHLLLVRYMHDKGGFIPAILYLDAQIMIKKFTDRIWIIMLGTAGLEKVFGIVRTMIGSDSNVDQLQLANRVTGATKCSRILQEHPEWDRGPRRLAIPSLQGRADDASTAADHVNPASWTGDVSVQDIVLQTCSYRGRTLTESDLTSRINIFSVRRRRPELAAVWGWQGHLPQWTSSRGSHGGRGRSTSILSK
ncbi:hypothetical protein OH76DRAFT_1424034 [Lentinus brumalis]|uniref:Uncharacterized protein n=1 Tax=Lentinus brumalis TaxID=2498619 RepID=A0A371CHX2_9APHY|nr:hypothetical protein OH76DRAFT_1424034 [Polyporus brumalis]